MPAAIFAALKPQGGTAAAAASSAGCGLPLLPQIVDTYVLSNFLFYLVLVLASFVLMTEVYNFFELMGDMIRNSSLLTMFTYLFFLMPQLIYWMLPISVLVAVLVTFGVLSKQNEVTAFKACGVSLYRLAAPVLIVSMLFSGALFAFDFQYVPDANRKQDELRDEIKGKPKQTYLSPDRKWIMGHDSRIYYYKYFDPRREGDGRRQHLRAGPGDVPPEAADPGAARGMERVDEDLDFRERLEQRFPRPGARSVRATISRRPPSRN